MLLWLGFGALPWVLALSAVGSRASAPRQLRWISRWARVVSRTILDLLRFGGARYVREGYVATDVPGIVVMNHQSVLDILTACVMTGPVVPAFVARARYARAPIVGTAMGLAGCPVVDPRQDRDGAVAAMRRAVHMDRALLVYPEGHRTPDGEVQPFRTAGLRAMLEERRVPVWLVATDGFCAASKVVDFVLHVHRIDGRTAVLGRYDPPEDVAALDDFLAHLHAELSAGVHRLREARVEARASRTTARAAAV